MSIVNSAGQLLRKNLIPAIITIGCIGVATYAAAPTGGYTPGATLNPNCAPGDTDCVVQAGDITNDTWKMSGTDIIALGAKVGIGIVVPRTTFDVLGSDTNSGIAAPRYFLASIADNQDSDGVGTTNDEGPWYGIGTSSYNSALTGTVPTLAGYLGVGLRSASGQLFMNGVGNVGIGTTSPDFKLHINAGSMGAGVKDGLLVEANGNSGTSRGVGILLKTGTSGTGTISSARIQSTRFNSGNGTDLSFQTSNDAGVMTDHMLIDENGNVGIGAPTPDSNLHVLGDVDSGNIYVAKFEDSNSGGYSYMNLTNNSANPNGTGIRFTEGLGNAHIQYSHSGSVEGLSLKSNGTGGADMLINKSGNVGIGIATPVDYSGRFLQIHSTSGSASRLKLSTTTSGVAQADGAGITLETNNNLSILNREDGDIKLFTNNSEKVTIKSNGNVGIGVITPHSDALLDVKASNKGIGFPQVALTSLSSFAPLSAHTAGMTVYNTTNSFPLLPGIYTNDGTEWIPSRTTGKGIYGEATMTITQDGATTGGPVDWNFAQHVVVGAAGPTYNADGTITVLKGTYVLDYHIEYSQYTSYTQGYSQIFTNTSGAATHYNHFYPAPFVVDSTDRSNYRHSIKFYVPESYTFKLGSSYMWANGSANGVAKLTRLSL